MLTTDQELEVRLRRSASMLRAWNWMGAISDRQQEAVAILTEEAKLLIQLGVQHPRYLRRIGRLIVAYQHLIKAIERRMERRLKTAA